MSRALASMDFPRSSGSTVSRANLIRLDTGKESVYPDDSTGAAVAASCKELGHMVPIIYDRHEMTFLDREDCSDRMQRHDW